MVCGQIYTRSGGLIVPCRLGYPTEQILEQMTFRILHVAVAAWFKSMRLQSRPFQRRTQTRWLCRWVVAGHGRMEEMIGI